jgi:hypothetical protein
VTRFDQCTVTCTTDCGHCKGDPVGALRTDLERLARRLAGRFEETEHLRAELEAARPVVEAAAEITTSGDMPTTLMWVRLATAVDLYRSATSDHPSTTEEKP